MYKAHPSQGKRYYLRLLLLHQTRVTHWKDLRTVNDHEYETYREACDALGLLKDDEEWRNCLREAAESQSPQLVYNLFVTILTQCLPDNPVSLWNEFKTHICELFFRRKGYNPETASPQQKEECIELGLRQLKMDLAVINPDKSNDFYDLPEPEHWDMDGIPQIILKELNYNAEEQREVYEDNYKKFNTRAGRQSQKEVPFLRMFQYVEF